MKTALFDFVLPEQLIALRPATPRELARLLVVHGNGALEHRQVSDLPGLLTAGDILCINDSKVIQARLMAIRSARSAKSSDVEIDVTLHKRDGDNIFRAFVQRARRLRAGDILRFGSFLSAEVLSRSGPEAYLVFNYSGDALDSAIAQIGLMPLPPYIARHRSPDASDLSDYQTVYARQPGSVAAPTAGLHFTPALLARLEARNVEIVRTTLHVGAGTFLPVKAEDTNSHHIHAERATVMPEVARRLNAARAQGGRIIATGTTTLRTLESAAEPDGQIRPFDDETKIFITPGYRFRTVDVLLTNFHLPRSTLFMLASAFMGLEVMRAAYAEAIREKYRFYSYGDACLLIRSS